MITTNLDLSSFYPDYMKIVSITEEEDCIRIIMISQTYSAVCPICGEKSLKARSYFLRTINNLPILGKPVILDVNGQEYYCTNAHCTVKTFREQLPGFLSVRQQWTNRSEDFIISLSLNMSCEAASIFCNLNPLNNYRCNNLWLETEENSPYTYKHESYTYKHEL